MGSFDHKPVNAHPHLLPHTHWDHRKEVDFGSGKVLLAKLGDNIYATSAFCTHYGAQLANGVLVKDGRIVWYVDRVTLFHLHLGLTLVQPVARRYELHQTYNADNT